jgi:hemerythrin
MVMNTLIWRDEYCVGNDLVDTEHRRLFDIANEILHINNPLMKTSRIGELVKELYSYMRDHFKHEEALMESISFKGIEEHKAMHQSIVTEMNTMLKRSRDYIQLDNMLVSLMNEWVLKHIVEEDVKHCRPHGEEGGESDNAASHTEETPAPA